MHDLPRAPSPAQTVATRVVVGAGAAVAQLVADVVLRTRQSPLYGDALVYHQLAAGVALHGRYGPPVADRPPGWVLTLALAYRVLGVHPNVGLAVNAVVAGLTAVLLVHVGRRIGLSTRLAAAGALGNALFPWTLLVGATLYSEVLYNLVVVAVALVALSLQDAPSSRRRASALLGLLCGIALLVRPPLLLWLPIGGWLAMGGFVRRRIGPAVAFAVCVVVVLTPWTLRNEARLHALVPFDTRGGITLAAANNDLSQAGQSPPGPAPTHSGSVVDQDAAYRRAAIDWITSHPAEFAARVPQRIVRSFDPTTRLITGVIGRPPLRWAARAAWAVVVAVAALGLWDRRRTALVPGSIVAAHLAVITVFGGGFRFLLPCVPFIALWAAAGMGVLAGRARPAPRFSAPPV